MCTWVEVENLDGSGEVVTGTAELAHILGCAVADLVSVSGDVLSDDECLCDLDEEATGEKLGYSVVFMPDDGFDVLMTQVKP
jgi:hypothetical protein